ncbi:MAG: hypothetical protein JXB48_13795 [Candidatus Latescibacteria bacterium]|nr:hypothetical protein [Candidatus Latescibacterota bacterium]
MTSPHKNRNTYFIKKEFQAKIIAQFITLVATGSLISGILLYFLISNETGLKIMSTQQDIDKWDILLPSILLSQLSVIILISLATVYMVLYFSHKIAGPLYKIEKIIEEIGNGNFKESINFREKDELKPINAALQCMIDNLREKINGFHYNYEEFKKIEDILHNAIQTSKLSEKDKNLLAKSLEKSLVHYDDNLEAFVLPGNGDL